MQQKHPLNNPHIDSSTLHKLCFIFMPCFQNSIYLDNLTLINFSLSINLITSWPQIGQFRIGLGTLVGSFGEPFALAFHHWIEGPFVGFQMLLVSETLHCIIGQPNESTKIKKIHISMAYQGFRIILQTIKHLGFKIWNFLN
jgi:hypothetical protein